MSILQKPYLIIISKGQQSTGYDLSLMDKPFLKMNHHQRFSLSISKTTQIIFAEASPKHCVVSHLCIPRDSNCQRTCIYHHLFFELHTLLFSPRVSNPHIPARYPYILARFPSHASYIPTLQHIDPLTRPYSEIR